ncbi:unnamed protein product [Rhizophagus irregularis]|nr:unnamed protein product [Rhizophagus irregularis]
MLLTAVDSKASGLYNGRNLVGSWTFARMFLTAIARHQHCIMEGILLDHGHLLACSLIVKRQDYIMEGILLDHEHLRGSCWIMDICAHVSDNDSKASELYNGRDLVRSWTFARMLLTAVSILKSVKKRSCWVMDIFAQAPDRGWYRTIKVGYKSAMIILWKDSDYSVHLPVFFLLICKKNFIEVDHTISINGLFLLKLVEIEINKLLL